MSRRAVFLDLNGTLVLPLKPERLSELVPVPGAAEAVARLTAAGFACPVVTVQSRIAKGHFTAAEFGAWFVAFADTLRGAGAEVAGPYVCPHRFAEPCGCKKPGARLYVDAARELHLDVAHSFVVGDSPDDMRAAARLGVPGVLVATGERAAPPDDAPPAALVPSIVEAVDWILRGGATPNAGVI